MHTDFQWSTSADHLRRTQPDLSVLYFCPSALQEIVHRFQRGFPGLVTYAVKANPEPEVLANLSAAGVTAFDVASPAEMRAVRAVAPDAILHYNNPVRSSDEVICAVQHGVRSYSVDEIPELDKLHSVPQSTEIAVRFALPISGAAYDFGSKFGTSPDGAVALLQEVAQRGYQPGLCFHPGTQCADPAAWGAYIQAAADITRRAGVPIRRINVGGGFASHRSKASPDLEAIFAHIKHCMTVAFPDQPPVLLCEPGRALVADAFCLATRIKAVRANDAVFLNDGIYGALAEARDIGAVTRLSVLSPDGTARSGALVEHVAFGPTCDSLDRLPDPIALPDDAVPGDYVLFDGMGAYSSVLATQFNGYGPTGPLSVAALR